MGDSGSSSSELKVKNYPSAYGTTDYSKSSDLAKILEGMVTSGPSDLQTKYEQEILDPDYSPQTSSEESLINSVIAKTGGQSAIRGLGAPSQPTLASAIAPELETLRRDRVSSLDQALGIETSETGLNSSTLLNLINYAMPQILSSNSGQSEGADQTGQYVGAVVGIVAAYL